MQNLQSNKRAQFLVLLLLFGLLITAGIAVAGQADANGATQTAEYKIVFDAIWDPEDVPGPHFSRLVGGTHNASTVIWTTGELASDGIEVMAETGGTSTLLTEISNNSHSDQTLLGDPAVSPGTAEVDQFTVNVDYPLLTLVTMIAPSPDWFVGVSGLSLLDEQGEWRDEIVVQLRPYDAGTDSGPDFTSQNDDTNPAEPIFLIEDDSLFPEPILGTFTISRLDTPAPTPTETPIPQPSPTVAPPFIADEFIFLPIIPNGE